MCNPIAPQYMRSPFWFFNHGGLFCFPQETFLFDRPVSLLVAGFETKWFSYVELRPCPQLG